MQYLTNEQGEKTAVILPIDEYENLLHQAHHQLELTDEYKQMIDQMLEQEANGTAQYVLAEAIKTRFKGQ